MSRLALGVVVLNRVDKLANLLQSARSTPIDKVYVADNGRDSAEKDNLYATEFPFELEVLDLEYDVGLGYCRNEIVDRLDEELLMVADSDHAIIGDIDALVSVLEERPGLGGVAGSLVEPERGRIWQSAKDFREADGKLYRAPHFEDKEIETVAGTHFVAFDFVPYPTLYRRECVTDYTWDPEYPLGRAHVDFYVGHWKQTDWEFGICPSVHFEHYPGGDVNYSSHRQDSDKYRRAKEHFRQKWGYDAVEMERTHWFDSAVDDRTLVDKAYQLYRSQGPTKLVTRGFKFLSRNLRRS